MPEALHLGLSQDVGAKIVNFITRMLGQPDLNKGLYSNPKGGWIDFCVCAKKDAAIPQLAYSFEARRGREVDMLSQLLVRKPGICLEQLENLVVRSV